MFVNICIVVHNIFYLYVVKYKDIWSYIFVKCFIFVFVYIR